MKSGTQFSWNCVNDWSKSRLEVIVTSNCFNNNLDKTKKTKRRPTIVPAIAVRLLKKQRKHVKLTRLKKICSQKPQICLNTILSHFTLKNTLEKSQSFLDSCSSSYSSVTKITSPVWILIDMEKGQKSVNRSLKKTEPIQPKFFGL